MILPFSTKFKDGTPTYFIEKIWRGLGFKHKRDNYDLYNECKRNRNLIDVTVVVDPKLHTIREDIHNRWKPGMKIHMVVFNRSKNQFQFVPVLECKSVQYIRIIHDGIFDEFDGPTVYMGNRSDLDDLMPFYFDAPKACYGVKQMEQLARNDGFDSIEHFFSYFNKDFTGKIIHWTDLRYE